MSIEEALLAFISDLEEDVFQLVEEREGQGMFSSCSFLEGWLEDRVDLYLVDKVASEDVTSDLLGIVKSACEVIARNNCSYWAEDLKEDTEMRFEDE